MGTGSLHKCNGNVSNGGSVQHGVSLNGASSVSPLVYYLPPSRENATLLSLPPALLIHIGGAYDSQSAWVGKPRGVSPFLPFHHKGKVSLPGDSFKYWAGTHIRRSACISLAPACMWSIDQLIQSPLSNQCGRSHQYRSLNAGSSIHFARDDLVRPSQSMELNGIAFQTRNLLPYESTGASG